MRISRTIPLALAAMLAAGAATAAPATGRTVSPTNINGKVDAVFGRQIVLATDTAGKVLVDVGHHPVRPPIAVGETLQVSGQAKGNRLKARELTRADGSTLILRQEPGRHGQHGKEAGRTGSDD